MNSKAEKPERGTVLSYITLSVCLVFKHLLDYGWFSLTARSWAKICLVYLCLYQVDQFRQVIKFTVLLYMRSVSYNFA